MDIASGRERCIHVTSRPGTKLTVHEALEDHFTITDRVLGLGATGRILLALDQFKRRQRACKIIGLEKFPRNRPNRGKLWREVELLRRTSHVNIKASLRN